MAIKEVTMQNSLQKRRKIKLTKSDIMINAFTYALFGIILLVIIYPLYFIVISSFSDPTQVASGNVVFWIKGFSLDGYKFMLEYDKIWIGYGNTLVYTFLATPINILVTMALAYPLSRRNFSGRRVISRLIVFTMYFSGGMIPLFILIMNLGLYDTRLVMILLGIYTVPNVIIARTFLQETIPSELEEAAMIDGCNHMQVFIKIVLPLSKAIIGVLALYYGVAHWNEYMKGMLYLQDAMKQPLQLVLRDILINTTNTLTENLDDASYIEQMRMAEAMKYSTIIVSSLPVMIIYPLIQKRFEKGVLSGAVKG